MQNVENFDSASAALARRVLFVTLGLALSGAGVGVAGILLGSVADSEAILVVCSLVFSLGALITLGRFRSVELQTVATVATAFFSINLCTGVLIALFGRGERLNLFVYLLWFFPLLIFNKLVNSPVIGQMFAKVLHVLPVALVVCLAPRWLVVLQLQQRILLGVFCLSYLCYASTINLVTRYREKYIAEHARARSLKIEADILESISDCFISLDSEGRLIYLNDAACTELGVRHEMLGRTLSDAAPDFLPGAVLDELKEAALRDFASFFEVLSRDGGLWYDLRCFPRSDGLSIYFRNITHSMLSRLKLDDAHRDLRKQAELLDKAQDAIFVVSLDLGITYWNKGAERLYGWSSEEALGQRVESLFRYDSTDVHGRIDTILRDGSWSGELSQYCKDGRKLIVESRCALVRADDGTPTSVLAINTDITARKADEARITYLAFYDVLTGLPNRQFLRDRLTDVLSAPANQNSVGALLYIDLDDFKTLNDTMGHDVGDALLQQAARRLTDCLKSFDVVARLGGDEFVVMLGDLYDDAQAASVAARIAGECILKAFREPFVLGTYESESKASIGVTLFSGATDTVDQLLKRTDLAMYRAKAKGRNNLCFFELSMQTDVDKRAALRWDLRRALINQEFQLHYQPQVDSCGNVIGAEALIRWFHPLRGRVSPDEFIPVAEEAGLIVELGRWVLETACRQIEAWARNPLTEELTVAVNVSVRQFLDPQFVELVREALRTSKANPRRLKLEITESSTMERIGEVIGIMADLRSEGVSFSLDDFGTGYSSLAHLQHLPLDQLKIDRSFVNNVLTHPKDAAIARTIIMLGGNLGLAVIAEGVETEGQRAFLEVEGCHLYQGFLYSPAVPARQFEDFVVSSRANTFQHLRGIETAAALVPVTQ